MGPPPQTDGYIGCSGRRGLQVQTEADDVIITGVEGIAANGFTQHRPHRVAGRFPPLYPVALGGLTPAPSDLHVYWAGGQDHRLLPDEGSTQIRFPGGSSGSSGLTSQLDREMIPAGERSMIPQRRSNAHGQL